MDNRSESSPGTISARVIKGAAWISGARILISLIGLVSTVIMARLLDPADFGLVAIALSLFAIAAAITSMPVGTALVQVKILTKGHLDTAWTLSAIRGALIALVLAVLAAPISWSYGDPRLAPIIFTLSFATFVSTLGSPAMAILTRELVFWQDFVMQTLARAAGFAVGVYVAWQTHSYWGLVFGNVASSITAPAISFCISRYRPKISLCEWRDLLAFSGWLSLSEIVSTANWRADQLILGWKLGPGELGYYTVGGDLAGLPTREVGAPLVHTLFPAFSKIGAHPLRLAASVAKTQALLVAVILPVGLGFALLADRIVPIVLGPKWLVVVPIIQILATLYGFQALSLPTQPLAMAQRENRALFIRDVLILLTRLPFVIGGMLAFGLIGAVWGRAIAGTIHVFINLEMIDRLCGYSVGSQLVKVWRTLASALTMIAAVVGIRMFLGTDALGPFGAIGVEACAGVMVYVGSHWLFWQLSGQPDGAERTLLELTRRHSPIGWELDQRGQ